VLAQETPILLLDKPTMFLDLAYQIELMERLKSVNAERRTLMAMVHKS
jgi:iron complex transport system ATP-binding protein